MDRLALQRTRLHAPIVETVRDPDFLTALSGATDTQRVTARRAASIIPGRTFDVTAAPMPGGGAVAVLRDLTETERVEKTRRDFIANVSHELRTPLTSIQGYTETLLDSSPDSNHAREFLEIIRKNAARMSRLTEDLLTLARVESGEEKMQFEAVPASVLIEEAARTFSEMAGGGLKLKVASTSEVLREACAEVFESWLSSATEYFAGAGIDRGEAHRLALCMLSLLEGAFIFSRAMRTTEPVLVAGAAAAAAVEDAVRRQG